MRSSLRSSSVRPLVAAMALSVSVCVTALAQTRPSTETVGTAMTPEDFKLLPMDSGPSGRDLPPGSGTAKQGASIFTQKCAMCHRAGDEGRQPAAPGSGDVRGGGQLVGGKGLPLWGKDSRGVAGPGGGISRSWYAAYPTTIWNAVAVSMPTYNSGSLTPDEAYSLVAFILARNEIIPEDLVLNRETLPEVQMPRRNDYLPAKFEDILDIKKRGCYKTFAICEPIAVPEGSFKPPPGGKW